MCVIHTIKVSYTHENIGLARVQLTIKLGKIENFCIHKTLLNLSLMRYVFMELFVQNTVFGTVGDTNDI